MGMPWLVQVRKLHITVLCLVVLSILMYVAYVSPSQLSLLPTFKSQVIDDVNADNNLNTSHLEYIISRDYVHGLFHSGSSDLPLSHTAYVTHKSNITEPDLLRGVAAELIYEAGHLDFQSAVCVNQGKELTLLMIVTSAPSHYSARMAIRDTWGHFGYRKDVSIAFMLGFTSDRSLQHSIINEQYLYGDIIRGKFIDTYDNLTLKTISMLEWIDSYCSKTAYVLKTDDDMFINVSKLLTFISKLPAKQKAIYGRLAKKWKPIRNKKSKYYISPQQYKPAVFPDFTTGPAYLFPAYLAKELYIESLNHAYFKLEDVFVTGIVANVLNIKRIHAPDFLNKKVSLSQCTVQRGISIHMVKGLEQYDLWKKLHDNTAKCKLK